MKLIKRHVPNMYHPSMNVTCEFEHAILEDSSVKVASSICQYCFIPFYYLDKVCQKINFPVIDRFGHLFVQNSFSNKEAYFAILMGMDFNKYYPYAFFNRKKRYIYFFDVWAKDQDKIIDFIEKYKIDRVFVSASESASELNEKLRKDIAYWIPEGVDISQYRQIPYDKKDIDVIQIGRKYDLYHEKILPYFQHSGKVYLYEKIKGEVIFKETQDFIDGLSRSKISICVPSNITHPERSGNVETMTNRYLQSMASKSLILGVAPKEMIELFGYNPVIEIDMEDTVKQLDDILENYEQYIPLIEKNFDNLSRYHTWGNRWSQIKDILSEI